VAAGTCRQPPSALSEAPSYAELDRIAQSLKARDVVEFWKSAPYPLNLMDDYVLSREFEVRAASGNGIAVDHRLEAETIRRYREVDPGNARLRGLLEQLDSEGAWKCLWLPPSLPYYAPGRPFNRVSLGTKRLIFSSWRVVPKAIAALTSYHVDRQMLDHLGVSIQNSQTGRRSLGQPLQWRAGGSMVELLLAAPGRELSRLTDPLTLARARSSEEDLPRRDVLLRDAEREVREALRGLDLPRRGGRPDRAWYVVAMLRLDEAARPGSVDAWLRSGALGAQEDHRVWSQHVARVRRALESDDELGAVPSDLAQVLAYVGLAGPGPCALRALQRSFGDIDDGHLEQPALRIANALRLMLNLPEAVLTVRSFATSRARIQTTNEEVYWRAALDYCAAGNLQAVLDEYVHALSEWVGGSDAQRKLNAVAGTAAEAIGVNAASLPARHIISDGRISDEPLAFRTRFALRLDQGQGEDEQSVHRIDTVRKAFNSPFWPFVLATTSIGQEGLDFHLYAHAVVHWNLPSNPVDLEQREGRVHRFKNHAVRRNLAAAHREVGIAAAPRDPWQAMFDAVPEEGRGLHPYWVFTGDARIERHVPAEPLSIDHHRLDELVRLMGIYRLAFGQPRQDEMLAALGTMDGGWDDLIIDLAPPTWS
jgi:Helicase conserved C-terminal domain